jgi:hypothetical protein
VDFFLCAQSYARAVLYRCQLRSFIGANGDGLMRQSFVVIFAPCGEKTDFACLGLDAEESLPSMYRRKPGLFVWRREFEDVGILMRAGRLESMLMRVGGLKHAVQRDGLLVHHEDFGLWLLVFHFSILAYRYNSV